MNFLSITDLTAKQIRQILKLAKKLKYTSNKDFKGKTMVMLFEKPSLRTKLSFDVAMNQLGGHPVYFSPQEFGLGTREPASDIGKVVSRMADLIVARVFSHRHLLELAQNSRVPVINALSNLEHPCQALADFLTIWEMKGKLESLTLAYVGDGDNNVTHSLALGCALLGINFKCASPKGFWMNKEVTKRVKEIALKTEVEILETDDPKKAVKDVDVVYTDTWVSMGDEKEKAKRLKIFTPFQVDQQLMKLAKKDAIFMHDMPAYRGNEVAAEVIDGPQSVIFQQAENRLHAQKALMAWLMSNQN
ncbi:MAG: ornithine carbamoyltransferase [Candidatus Daviesbacteria bacterium]|nr:ornithine carbamoyltransferase [Candidatus Daviesbacteria bacterium]